MSEKEVELLLIGVSVGREGGKRRRGAFESSSSSASVASAREENNEEELSKLLFGWCTCHPLCCRRRGENTMTRRSIELLLIAVGVVRDQNDEEGLLLLLGVGAVHEKLKRGGVWCSSSLVCMLSPSGENEGERQGVNTPPCVRRSGERRGGVNTPPRCR